MEQTLPEISRLSIYSQRYQAVSKALEELEYFYDGLNKLPESELIDYHMDSSDLVKLQDAARTLEFIQRGMFDNIQKLGKSMIR